MFTLVLLALLTLGVGFFATQNTGTISLSFGYWNLENIPVYVAVILPLFVGLVGSWLTTATKDLEFRSAKKRLKNDLAEARAEIGDLTKRVHKLELDNTRLRAESGKPMDEDSI